VDALLIIAAALSLTVIGVVLRSSSNSSFVFYGSENVLYYNYSVLGLSFSMSQAMRLVNNESTRLFPFHPWGLFLNFTFNALMLTFVGLATSLFAAARSKGAAKVTVLALVLSVLIAKAIPFGYDGFVEWQRSGWYRVRPWGVKMPPPPLMGEPWTTIRAWVPYAVPTLLSLVLLWLAVRRLKREA
jgi:hypothetical protein